MRFLVPEGQAKTVASIEEHAPQATIQVVPTDRPMAEVLLEELQKTDEPVVYLSQHLLTDGVARLEQTIRTSERWSPLETRTMGQFEQDCEQIKYPSRWYGERLRMATALGMVDTEENRFILRQTKSYVRVPSAVALTAALVRSEKRGHGVTSSRNVGLV